MEKRLEESAIILSQITNAIGCILEFNHFQSYRKQMTDLSFEINLPSNILDGRYLLHVLTHEL